MRWDREPAAAADDVPRNAWPHATTGAPHVPSPWPRYLPIGLDLRGRRVVVVGGDGEAEAKVRTFLRHGAAVVVVGRSLGAGLAELARAGRVDWRPRPFRAADLDGATLAVVSASGLPSASVERVRRAAARRRVLVNVVDHAEISDVIAMATIERGPLEVAIHSSGQSAAFTRRLAEILAETLPPAVGDVVATLGRLRPRIRRHLGDPAARRAYWLNLVDRALVLRALSGDLAAEVVEAMAAAALGACDRARQEEARR